ncbi:hypothetical protein [Egbenema bharatensis]|uniref:hypothetical protein n=1 Tax=Egbenema bharatensis TaxID=3463334 RepID=UPI003A8AD610
MDQELALVANGAGSVGNVISPLGIPIINAYGCESGHVHAPNEWLNLKTIQPVFQTYWASLIQFCLTQSTNTINTHRTGNQHAN